MKKIYATHLRNENKSTILFILLVILLIAHGTLGENGRNLLLSSASLLIAFLLISYVYVFSRYSRNAFLLVILIYASSHFPLFLEGGGGFFNILSFGLLLLLLLFQPKEFLKSDKPTLVFLWMLILINCIGYITGELDIFYIINGAIVFFGFIFILYITHRITLTNQRIKIIIQISAILGILNLLVTLNTTLGLLNINSPLFISFYEKSDYQLITNSGTIGTIELFGEWGMLNSFLLLPFLTLKQSTILFRRKDKILIIIGWLSSFFCALLSFSKAVFLLSILGLILYFIFNIVIFGKLKLIPKILALTPLLFLFIPFLFTFLELDFIMTRINENPDFLVNFLNNPLSGEGTTREAVYKLGLDRIAQQNWFFGNGWSIPQGNYFSWFGSYSYLDYADYHSLYLCLIPIFGFSGLSIFVLFFLTTIKKTFFTIRKFKKANTPLLPLLVGLLFVLTFFLIDEYKINATRNSYFTITIIWLGLTINANKTIKHIIND